METKGYCQGPQMRKTNNVATKDTEKIQTGTTNTPFLLNLSSKHKQ